MNIDADKLYDVLDILKVTPFREFFFFPKSF